MPKPFDAASKHLIENRPPDWVRLAGFPTPDSSDDVSIVDADLSNVTTAAADKLIRVDNALDGGRSYLAHIGFQSSADPALDLRVLGYNVMTRRRHELPVLSAVFLLRPQEMTASVTGRVFDQIDPVARLDFGYHLIRVWELAPALLMSAGVGVLPLVPIAAVNPDELPSIIAAVKQRLESEMPTGQGKEFMLAMRVLMGLRYQEQFMEALMQSIAEMTDSVEWRRIYRNGKKEGLVEGERLLLIRQGKARFGVPPGEILERLHSTSNSDELGRMADRMLTASGWDELFDR